jgi:hypothetical protein
MGTLHGRSQSTLSRGVHPSPSVAAAAPRHVRGGRSSVSVSLLMPALTGLTTGPPVNFFGGQNDKQKDRSVSQMGRKTKRSQVLPTNIQVPGTVYSDTVHNGTLSSVGVEAVFQHSHTRELFHSRALGESVLLPLPTVSPICGVEPVSRCRPANRSGAGCPVNFFPIRREIPSKSTFSISTFRDRKRLTEPRSTLDFCRHASHCAPTRICNRAVGGPLPPD